MRWWVTLGDFESDAGAIVEVRFSGARFDAVEVTRWRPPEDRRVYGKGFTGATWAGERLLVCSFNGVQTVDRAGVVRDLLLRPDFNDLHHVASDGRRLWVSNTGLDRIDVFEADGSHVGGFGLVSSEEEHGRRSEVEPNEGYFRQMADLPFHRRRIRDRVHPNHVAHTRRGAIATCFETRRLVRLDDLTVVGIVPGHPHDGFIFDGELWVTCTSGAVLAFDLESWAHRVRHDVFTTGFTGWCRGLWVGERMVLVGLTRIVRPPRVQWCDRPYSETRTAVLAIDRRTSECLAVADLAPFFAHAKLFSIVEVPEATR